MENHGRHVLVGNSHSHESKRAVGIVLVRDGQK